MADITIQIGDKDSAWFTDNATHVLLKGQVVFLEGTARFKKGDGGTQLSSLSWSDGTLTSLIEAKEDIGVAQSLVGALETQLLDGVASAGNTFQKLYNLILGAAHEYKATDITDRDLFDVPSLPYNVFVVDDGDGKWALYSAFTTGVGATYVKLMDEDLLSAVMTAAQIKTAYESNPDTNAFTNALKTKLDNLGAATESVSGLAAIATQAEIEVTTSTLDTEIVTPKKFWLGLTAMRAAAWTWSGFQRFTNGIRINVVSEYLKANASGDIIGAGATIPKADVGLGNVSNDAQLKIASNLSDLASPSIARANLGVENTHWITADVATSSISLSDVTDLKFSMVAGTYKFRFIAWYTSAATSTGGKFAVDSTATVTMLRMNSQAINSTTGNGNIQASPTAEDSSVDGTNSALDGNRAMLEGIITVSGSGDLILRFASEVNASAITVKAFSSVTWMRLA